MKKLLFATALVASAAAFADGAPTALNAISFEGYSAGVTVGDALDELDVAGGTASMYFLYQGDQDGSTVKTYGGENLSAPAARTAYFTQVLGATNDKYLELSTEGGVLWRSINVLGSDGPEGGTSTNILGNAQAVAENGTYMDTLVQFTPTEDGGNPELGDEDKLAIWLNVDSSVTPPVTNLMVRAGAYDDQGTLVTDQTFVLVGTGVQIVPGEWYRLTVKAVDNILPSAEVYKIPGFMVFINGTEMAATTSPLDADFLYNLREAEQIDAAQAAELASGKVLPSLLAGDPEATSTLQGVGFKGSGALDDLVWTTEDPFANTPGPSADYKVTIDGSDVVVTPSEDDLAAVQAAVIAGGGTLDVTDVAAVNAALAAPIGSTSIPSWQALFLGLPPTEAGLDSFKIDSISFDASGNVVVELPDDVEPKTGRGVDITIKLMGSDDLSTWTQIETATGTTFAPVTPGSGETKKFYKVVVEFAGSSN